MKAGNPKVMVVSLTKSGGQDKDQSYYKIWHYRRSVKTFLVKIMLMLWVQLVSMKKTLSGGFIQVSMCMALLQLLSL